MGIPLEEIQAAMKAAKKPAVRKAADEEILVKLDQLIDEIRMTEGDSNRLENLVQEARIFLPQRRRELSHLHNGYSQLVDTHGAIKAAVEMEAYLNGLGRLQGNVPMPILKKDGSRIHTNYRTDGLTDQELVVPFMDPTDRRIVLMTQYGNSGIDPSLMHQSESSMMNAMKLAGYATEMHGDKGDGFADLAATRDGRTKNIDVMVRREFGDKEHVPIYTSLVPIKDNGREARDSRGSGAAQHVKNVVTNRMERDKVGPFTAVESLVKENIVGPRKPEMRMGKVVRNKEGVMPQGEEYDALILPGYTPEIMRRGRSTSPQEVPTAPHTIQLMDLGMALDRLESGAMDSAHVKYVTNYGGNGKGYERLQIKPEFEMKPEAGVVDMTKAYPLTQQLLAEEVMRRRQVR